MKLIVTIQHPAHVHFYKHAIDRFEADGHDVWVFYRNKELVEELLDATGIEATKLAPTSEGLASTARNQALYELRLWYHARRIEPDVMTAIGGIAVAHVASLVDARSAVFTDTGDHAPLTRLGTRFADTVCTPDALDADYGSGHRRYPGYHELAYLHPGRFDPDPDALEACGVDPGRKYAVVRFSSWQAHHDVGHRGISEDGKRRLVDELAAAGDVYLSAEGGLPGEFRRHRLPVPPERMHDLLAFADYYVGDSSTTATEAAILGTPALRINSFAGEGDIGNFRRLSREYGLVYSTPDESDAIQTLRRWRADPDLSERWANRRDDLLEDTIDVTRFIVETIYGLHDGPGRERRDVSGPIETGSATDRRPIRTR